MPRTAPLTAASAACLLAAACSGSSSGGSGVPTPTVKVALDDRGCAPSAASAPAGPVTFEVTSSGSGKVSEVELMQGSRVLGEKENLAPGLGGSFTVQLSEGSYVLRCPGGSGRKDSAFTV